MYWKQVSSSLIRFIVVVLLFMQWRESMYDALGFKFISMTFIMQQTKTIKDKTTTSHWCFQSNLKSIKIWFKKFFNNFICSIMNNDFYVITLWINFKLFISSFEETKLTAIVNLIFSVSDFLRLFMMSFKYGLISSRYSLIDRVLFLSKLVLCLLQLLF